MNLSGQAGGSSRGTGHDGLLVVQHGGRVATGSLLDAPQKSMGLRQGNGLFQIRPVGSGEDLLTELPAASPFPPPEAACRLSGREERLFFRRFSKALSHLPSVGEPSFLSRYAHDRGIPNWRQS